MPMSNAAHPTPFHPKWYRRRVSVWWWLESWRYAKFVLRELTSLAVAFFAGLALWKIRAIAAGPEAYAQVSAFFGSLAGRTLLFLFSWSLIHHMLGGIRHLIWDTGHGLDKVSIEIFAWATIIGSIVLTVLVWVVGYWLTGAF